MALPLDDDRVSPVSTTPISVKPAASTPPAALDPVISTWPVVLDPDIPTLSAVLDPVELTKQIGLLPASQWPWGVPREIRVELLRWHAADRCTLEIAFRAASGWDRVIGKVYAADRPDVYQVMEGLERAGFGPEAEFSIPRPIGYLPSLRLLLQEKVEGMSAQKTFKLGDDRERAAAAERCARWLARFHTVAPPVGRVTDVEELLRRSERKWRFMMEEGGSWTAKSEQLFERLQTARSALAAVPMCAGHGDYAHNQVIFVEGRTVTWDWDVYDIADPTRDVASFIVTLERMALKSCGSVRALDGAAEVFLKTYLDARGQAPVAAHLPFYKAAYCLWEAHWEVKTKRKLGWGERAEAMLDEGLRTLDGVK